MQMTEAIGVALIGYGYVGETFHAPLIAATKGLDLRVVSSSKPQKVHTRFPEARVVETPEAAIADRAIRLVVIASPNTSHVPLATAALLAGKDLVVDKPFTITADEAKALEKLARDEKLLLSVFQNRRWDGDFLTLRALIAAGELGEINYFESHFDRFRPQIRDRWREKPGPGSGLWYDLGPHLIDQALQLFGMPETVEGSILTQRAGGQTDDYAHVVLGYDDAAGIGSQNLQVVLHGSMLVPGGWPRFLVHGSKASWIKHGLDVQEKQLISGMQPGAAGWGVDPSAGALITPDSERKVQNLRGSYELYYAAIRDALVKGGPNPVPAAQAVNVMSVLEAAIRSSKQGTRITLEG
jgi:predicted dehydrogenase